MLLVDVFSDGQSRCKASGADEIDLEAYGYRRLLFACPRPSARPPGLRRGRAGRPGSRLVSGGPGGVILAQPQPQDTAGLRPWGTWRQKVSCPRQVERP